MTIKELKKILKEAPNENAKVVIPDSDMEDIGWNFDDNNDLDLYVISKVKAFTVSSEDLLDKKKNPKQNLSAIDILKNSKIKKTKIN